MAENNLGRGRGNNARANAAHTSTGGSTVLIIDAERSGLTNLSSDQWQMLVEMLNNYKGSSNERMIGKRSEWIIDTRASNHMTRNIAELYELKDMQGCPVGLPDGKQATATKRGTVFLHGGLTLNNVFYVPKLHCSLISVSQLIDDTKCIVQFTHSLCVM